jgi:alkaline phosphatase D
VRHKTGPGRRQPAHDDVKIMVPILTRGYHRVSGVGGRGTRRAVVGPHNRSFAPRAPSRALAHGVATGDVSSTGFVLWTRARPLDRRLDHGHIRWSVWTTDGTSVLAGTARVDERDDFVAHVRVDDLQPATDYHVVVEAFGDRAVATTRTLPHRADGLRIAVTCCSRWGWPGFSEYGAVADAQADVVIHLGDYIYEVGEVTQMGPTSPPHECTTLDDYRDRYASHRLDPELRRLHGSTPFLAIWDDHEVTDNAPDDEGRARRVAGERAWREWMPVDPASDGLDRTRSIDGLLDLVVLDARYGGRDPVDTDGPRVRRAEGPLLSDAQWERLERAVEEARAPWFVLANQVQVSPMTLAWAPSVRHPPFRRVVNPDQWDGFPDERLRLAELLARVHGRPVILSGDLHAAWSRELLLPFVADGPIAHEFTAPSISGASYADAIRQRTHLPEWFVRQVLLRLNPGVDHLELGRHGYLVLDITPDELTVTFRYHDGTSVVRTLRADTSDSDGSDDAHTPRAS